MNNQNELVVLKVQQGIIETNFTAFKEYLTEEVKSFKTMVVTEDNLKEMKDNRKLLTNSRKVIDARRKEIKKQFVEPLIAYEQECKEAESIIGEAEKVLKEQTDRFDEQQRQKKRDLFAECCQEADMGILATGVELPDKFKARIQEPSWLTNIATSNKKIKENVAEQYETVLAAFNQMNDNIYLVEKQVVAASEMLELTTPLTVADVQRFIDDYETMNVAQVTESINNEAKRRKAAEEAAIKAAEERRLAEIARQKELEEKRKQEEIRRQEEAKRQAELQKKREEEAEAKRQANIVSAARRDEKAKELANRMGIDLNEKFEEESEFIADESDFFNESEPIEPKSTFYRVIIKSELTAEQIMNILHSNGHESEIIDEREC